MLTISPRTVSHVSMGVPTHWCRTNVMEGGGRTTGNQDLAILRQLADERAVAARHVVAPPLWAPVTPASLVALTVRKWQQQLSS